MTSHTPGPWRVSFGRYTPAAPVFGFSIEADGKVPPVASAGVATPNHVLITVGVPTGYEPAEVEANAHLIAAAPDVLEAARKTLALLDQSAPGIGWYELRAAIAKA